MTGRQVVERREVAAAGWGRFPRMHGELLTPSSLDSAQRLMSEGTAPLIARGLARSYGDAALGPRMVSTAALAGIESLDRDGGRLRALGGTSLDQILDVTVPHGWFPPVVPGTRYVTLGGAIASDIHGKNHHVAGSLARHVEWLDLLTADGSVVRCGADENRELFEATCGGMGLTGVIVRASLAMVPVETAHMRQETVVAGDLEEALGLFRESEGWTYSVAWIDCRHPRRAGRAILFRGEHLTSDELRASGFEGRDPLARRRPWRPSVPFATPGMLLNSWTMRAFNALYYHVQRARAGSSVVPLDPFFFPLDGVRRWNRLYGRRGFIQHQSVLPLSTGAEGVARLLEAAREAGQGSFLAVLKLLGPGRGWLSFPLEGLTLALDFPVRRGTLALARRMDEIVTQHGGRVYLTKDAHMEPPTLERGYPDLSRFRSVRDRWDPERRFQSLQSRRLGL